MQRATPLSDFVAPLQAAQGEGVYVPEVVENQRFYGVIW